MKKLKFLPIALIIAVFAAAFAACADGSAGGTQEQEEPLTGDSSVLVVYFSWSSSHNTQTMADYIAEETGGELFRLIPQTPYPTDYNEMLDIAQSEQAENARPALAQNISEEQFAVYDVVFVGYPIWWGDAPMIVYTFLESRDFTGKVIVPFATSGGSGLNQESDFRGITGAEVEEGLCIRNINSSGALDDIREWLGGLNL